MTVAQAIAQPQSLFGEKENTLFHDAETAAEQKNLPIDDIWVKDGGAIKPVSEVSLQETNVVDLFGEGEAAEAYARIRERGLSRSDIPQIREILGEEFPAVPDQLFTELPSRNGMELIQESFFKNVKTSFANAAKAAWAVICTIWRFVYRVGRQIVKTLWAKATAYNTYITRADMISAEVRAKLGSDYPQFQTELSAVLSVDELVAALVKMGDAIDVDRVFAKTQTGVAEALSESLVECAAEVAQKATVFKEYVEHHENGTHAADENEKRAMTIHQIETDLLQLWYKKPGALLKKSYTGSAQFTIPAVTDWIIKQNDEFEASVKKGDPAAHKAWVQAFIDNEGHLPVPVIKIDSVELDKALLKAEKLMETNSKIDPMNWSNDEDFEAFRMLSERVFSTLGEWTRFFGAATKYIHAVQGYSAEIARRVAMLESVYIAKTFIVLGKRKEWLVTAKWGMERFKQDLKRMGVYDQVNKFNEKPDDWLKVDENGDVAFGDKAWAGFKSNLNMLDYQGEVDGSAYKDDLIPEPMNLTAMQEEHRAAVREIDDVVYKIGHSGTVSKSDEQLYIELHERYTPDAPVNLTMEGFGLLKVGALAALAAAVYILVQRLIQWVMNLIRQAKNQDELSGKADRAEETLKSNESLKTNTSKREQAMGRTEPNAAMRKAAGKNADIGGEQAPVTTDDKVRALAAGIAEARTALLRTVEFDALQRGSTTLMQNYMGGPELDDVIRQIRRLRPVRISYLNDVSVLLDNALIDQRRTKPGEVSSKILGLSTALAQGKQAYADLFDNTNVFTFAGKRYPAYIGTQAFTGFVDDVFNSAKPVYPDEAFIKDMGKQVKDNTRALYASVSDQLSVVAQKRFREIEQHFRGVRDAAKSLTTLSPGYAVIVNEALAEVQEQLLEISAWYAFEERLRNTVSNFVDNVNAYAAREESLLKAVYSELGIQDAM